MKVLNKTFAILPGIFILSFFVFALFDSANGNTRPAHTTYKKETANGKYVFVMLAPNRELAGLGLNSENKEKALNIHDQYPLSGLYSINDSSKPLWTVDWYSYEYGTFISSDGKYLVRTGLDTLESSNEAISFYEANNQIKTYKISDLMDSSTILPKHFLWDWNDEMFVNEEENTLTVKTLTFDKIVFDMKTGEEISSIRPIRFIIFGILGFTFAMVLLYLGKKES